MDLLDHFRAQRQGLPSERLGVRHLTGADTCEVSVDEVGTYLALQLLEGPVADMLQYHHAQDNLGWGALASARAALGMPFHQGFINRVDQLLVIQHLVGAAHPRFPKTGGRFFNEAFTKATLGRTAVSDHFGLRTLAVVFVLALVLVSSFSRAFSLRSSCRLSSQIFSRA